MSALPVMASTIAKQALQAFVMQEIDVNGEAEYLRRVTSDKVAGEILYAAYRKAHFNLIRLRHKKLKLQHQLETGGRQKRRPSRHRVYHRRILEDYFGISPSISVDGVVHEAVGAFFNIPKFYRRFRMSPRMFEMIYHDITDPITGSPDFQKGPDAAGNVGASALQYWSVLCVSWPTGIPPISLKSTPVYKRTVGG